MFLPSKTADLEIIHDDPKTLRTKSGRILCYRGVLFVDGRYESQIAIGWDIAHLEALESLIDEAKAHFGSWRFGRGWSWVSRSITPFVNGREKLPLPDWRKEERLERAIRVLCRS